MMIMMMLMIIVDIVVMMMMVVMAVMRVMKAEIAVGDDDNWATMLCNAITPAIITTTTTAAATIRHCPHPPATRRHRHRRRHHQHLHRRHPAGPPPPPPPRRDLRLTSPSSEERQCYCFLISRWSGIEGPNTEIMGLFGPNSTLYAKPYKALHFLMRVREHPFSHRLPCLASAFRNPVVVAASSASALLPLTSENNCVFRYKTDHGHSFPVQEW